MPDPDNTLDLMVRPQQRRTTNIGNHLGNLFSGGPSEPRQTLSANFEGCVPDRLELVEIADQQSQELGITELKSPKYHGKN